MAEGLMMRIARVAAVLLAAACGGEGPAAPPGPRAPAPPAAVIVAPDSVVLTALGATTVLSVLVRDTSGAVLTDHTPTWVSADPAVASVSAGGTVVAVGDGDSWVRATLGPLRDSALVHVARVPVAVRLTPLSALLIGAGDTVHLRATADDARGHPIPGVMLTWSGTDPAIATVSASGVVRGNAHGVATVRVTAGPLATSAAIRVFGATGQGVATLDRLLVGHLVRWGVPGASVAVAHQGRLVHARGYGLADTTTRAPWLPTSRSRTASVAKSMTAAGVLALADAGTLSLDDRAFVRWLPDLVPAGGPADARLLDVTVRQLLQHTGGWHQPPGDPMFTPLVIAAWAGVPSPPDAATIIRYVATQPLQFTPGTQRYYSNVGYVILGRVIERATGQGYVSWLRDQMLNGVASLAGARSLPADRAAGEVTYYTGGGESAPVASVFAGTPGPVPFPYGGFAIEPLDAAGGLLAAAPDLVRFLLTVDGRPGRPDVISSAARIFMGTDAAVAGNLGNYGAGWFRIGAVWYHLGRVPGMFSAVVVDDARELAFAVLMNWSEPTAAFQNDMANALLAAVQSIGAWPAGDLFPDYP